MGNVALGITTDAADQKVPIASISSSTINTIRKHGLCAGDSGNFTGDDDHLGTAGITTGVYFVIASGLTDTAFKVSTTLGGSAASLTNKSPCDAFFIPTQAARGTNTAITATVSAGATTISVADASVLPAAPFVAIVGGSAELYPDEWDEKVLVTGKSGNDLTVVRGFEGTKDQLHTKVASPNSPNPQRKVWPRSLAPSACAMADFDAFEALIRAECSKATDDAYNGRANTLLRFTASTTTITTVDSGGSATAHGMVQGDRFVIVARSGTAGQGENVRLGHTYYVRSAPTTSTLTFCAERLHSSQNPYHASATETAAIDVGTAITGAGSYAFLRKLTSGGGTTRLLSVSNSLYPRMWGWGSNVGTLRDRTISATLHLRAVTDRAAQNMIHHTTRCSTGDDPSIKHTYQELTFKSVTGGTTGTFTLTIDGYTTGTITYSATVATLAARIKAAIEATAGLSGLSNIRVGRRSKRKSAKLVMKVTCSGARFGIQSVSASLSGGATIKQSGAEQLLIPKKRTQVTERWARQGAQIALASPALVFFRPNFEFEKKYFAWTSIPKNGVSATDGQQQAYDAWGDDASDLANPQKPWVNQWKAMRDAIVTTGGASNARMVWCPADGFPASGLKTSYPGDGYVSFTGFDYYVHEGSQTAAKMNDLLSKHVGGLRTVSSGKRTIACEFGFGAQASLRSEMRNLVVADPDVSGWYETSDDAGGGGESEPNTTASGSPSDRVALFKRWIQRVYSNHDNVVGAMYWDRDLGNAADHRISTTPSLYSAFAAEICKAKTRTAVS